MKKLFAMLSAIVSAAVFAASVPVTAHADALEDAQNSVVYITRNMPAAESIEIFGEEGGWEAALPSETLTSP